MQQGKYEMLGLSPCGLQVNKRQEVSLVCQCGPSPSALKDMLFWFQLLEFLIPH